MIMKATACIVLLLAFVLRVSRLDHQSVWWDEGYSISISSGSLAELTAATAADIHPPLYYYLLHFWMALAGQSEFAVRFLSVITGILLVALLWSFGSRLIGPKLGALAALLAAISPLYVAYAQETRMYTMETLLGLGSAYALFLLLKGKGSSRLLWAVYVAVTVLALYTDYFVAEVLLFENVFVLGWAAYIRSKRNGHQVTGLLTQWFISQTVVLVLYAPWLGIALSQLTGYGFGTSSTPPLLTLLTDMWHFLAVGSQVPLSTDAPFLYFAAAVLVAGLFFWFLKGWHDSEGKASTVYLLSYFLIPLAGFILALQFRPFYHPRYFLVITPSYYLLLSMALGGLWRLWVGVGALGITGTALAAILVLNAYYSDPAFLKDDSRSAASFVQQEAREDDLVLWQIPYPLQYYYRGKAHAQFLRVDPMSTP
ncbi:MAG: glycosyltransferase family 39 protein, partial [Chloroflexota bacterium]